MSVESDEVASNKEEEQTHHENDDDISPSVEAPTISTGIRTQIGNNSLEPIPTPMEFIPDIVIGLRNHFQTGITRTLKWRQEQLIGLIKILQKHEQLWVDAMFEDMGSHAYEAKMLIYSLVSEIKHTLDELEKWMKPEKKKNSWSLAPGKTYVIPEPYGVVCDFIPYNYPVFLGFSTLIPIFAAGNVCLFKPSSQTPACAALYQRTFPRFLDNDGIKVVCGPNSICPAILSCRYDFIFYTGSPTIGKTVMEAASKHLTPVILELGGKCPVYIDKKIALERSVKRLLFGKFFNGGQTCVAPDYCLVHHEIYDQFINEVQKQMQIMYGDPTKYNDNITHIINTHHFDRICDLVDNCEGEILINGLRMKEKLYIGPTIITNPPLESELMANEVFGPVLTILTVQDHNEAISFINSREKPLALSAFTSDNNISDDFIQKTSSGAILINEVVFHTSSPDCPFGGVGNSGMGQYHGEVGFKALSHMKPVINRKTNFEVDKKFPPYSLENLESIKKWI